MTDPQLPPHTVPPAEVPGTIAGSHGVQLPPSTFWRRFRRNKGGMIAAGYLVLLVFVALFADFFAPYSPIEQNLFKINQTPSAEHWLGTDDLGRDMLSRMIFGARISLQASVQAVGLALLIALPLGLIAGFFGGRFESLMMGLADAIQSFPAIVLAMTITAVLGSGLMIITIALAIVFQPTLLRLVRGQALAVREETYIEASKSIGTSSARIIRTRVLPNIASPLIVQASITLGFALLAEAALSFLGFGLQPPQASWGVMLSRSYNYIYSAGWQLFIPGTAITVTVYMFNLLGDGLRDSLGQEIRKG